MSQSPHKKVTIMRVMIDFYDERCCTSKSLQQQQQLRISKSDLYLSGSNAE